MKTNSKIALISAITAAVMLTSCSNNITAPTASASPDSKSTTSSANIFVPYTENDSSTEDSIAQDTAVVPPASDFKYQYDAVTKGITIIAYTGTEPSIRIPKEIDGDPVVAFEGEQHYKSDGFSAGYYATENVLSKSVKHLEFEEGFTSITGISGENVESVVIPEGVFSIGSFGYNIKSIHLPDSLDTIEKNAFNNCRELSDVNFPINLSYIGENAFFGCDLKEITIPPNIIEIERDAFSNCKNLTTVNFDKLNTSPEILRLEDDIFLNCENLKNVTLPDNLSYIPRGAFAGCTNLRDLSIPDSVTVIGNNAFYNCNALTATYHEVEYNYLSFDELYTTDQQ